MPVTQAQSTEILTGAGVKLRKRKEKGREREKDRKKEKERQTGRQGKEEGFLRFQFYV